jgi:hypothetical protein
MAAQTEIPWPVLDSPFCTGCATRMVFVRIFPHRTGYDTRTYECPECQHVVGVIVPFPERELIEG